MKFFNPLLVTIFLLSVICYQAHSQTLQNYSCIMDRIDISGVESSRSFDKDGIIKSENRYHPLSIAQYGVMAYYYFKQTKDSTYYWKCVNQINYFKNPKLVNYIFEGKGIGLPYNFNFWDLKAPWYSGMTQGYALSYLLRYHELTKDEEVLPIIEKVAYVLLQRQENGGTISTTKEGYTWIEEYPNSKRSPQVLNGYINGLIGLKEYVDFFPKDTLAKRILDETYIGATNSLQYFDSPTWSYYNRAKKSLSNKYLRYQIYEMKHLYEIFNDEIFDNQMRIWSVLSMKKYITGKSKAYKFPKHDISVPVTLIGNNRLGITSFQESLVLTKENNLNPSGLSKKQIRKIKRRQKKTIIHTFENDSVILANYVELSNTKITEDTKVKVYLSEYKNKIKPIDFEYITQNGSIRLYFSKETNINQLVLSLSNNKGLNDSKSIFKLYNTNNKKSPFFAHHTTEAIELKKDNVYTISVNKYHSDKIKIFYKFGTNSKWEARHIVDNKFTPKSNGVYQFMIVFNYESPLSSIDTLEIKVDNN